MEDVGLGGSDSLGDPPPQATTPAEGCSGPQDGQRAGNVRIDITNRDIAVDFGREGIRGGRVAKELSGNSRWACIGPRGFVEMEVDGDVRVSTPRYQDGI